ncbi:MAG: glycosyltransferase family 2 protein, partial [Chitinispirillia bacterium]
MEKIKRIKNCNNNYKIAVIIPTYNNCSTLREVINGVQKYIGNIIVINDGSTDHTINVLQPIRGIEIISFQRNYGKGHALKAGINKAFELNFTHVITFDSDGQHIAEDIPQLIKKIDEEPDVLWVGNRTLPYDKGYAPPRRSVFGR